MSNDPICALHPPTARVGSCVADIPGVMVAEMESPDADMSIEPESLTCGLAYTHACVVGSDGNIGGDANNGGDGIACNINKYD